MGETKQLAALVIATLAIGIVGLFLVALTPPLFEGDLVVSSYQATLYQNGTLHEQYTYNVAYSGEYRMLYRSWEAPLEFTSVNSSSIQLVSIDAPAGTVGYAKDDSGNVFVTGTTPTASLKSQVASLANTDETGIFDPSYFAAGTYTVGYTYVVHPPVEYDGTNDHLNLKFAGGSHIPYHAVEITVPADNVVQFSAYPPMLDTVKSGDTYVIYRECCRKRECRSRDADDPRRA